MEGNLTKINFNFFLIVIKFFFLEMNLRNNKQIVYLTQDKPKNFLVLYIIMVLNLSDIFIFVI